MKKKITACAAIGLAAVMFGACASWKDVYKLSSPDNLADYYAASGAFAQVTDLSDASGMNYTGYESGAIMFGGDGVQAYYFTGSGKFLKFTDDAENTWILTDLSYYAAGSLPFTVLRADNGQDIIYYDGLGNEFCRVSSADNPTVSVSGDRETGSRLTIEDKIFYAAPSGEIRLLTEGVQDGETVPSGIVTDKYIYSDDSAAIKVYERDGLKDGQVYREYLKKDYASTNWYVLDNGNVLVQEYYRQPDSEGDYDYILADGTKYNLKTYLWQTEKSSADNQKIDELDLRYRIEHIINGNYSAEERAVFAEGVENIAVVYPISEERLVTSETAVLALGNDGKGKCRLDAEDKISGINDDIVSIGENRWQVSDKHGFTYIVDNECNVISRWKTDSVTRTGAFSEVGDVLYNSDMTEAVYNLKEQNAEVIASYNDCVILSKQADGGTVYYMYDGAEHEISDYVGTNELGYYTQDAEGKYCYYIGKTLLCESYGAAYFTGTGEYVLVRYTAENSGGNLFKLIKP